MNKQQKAVIKHQLDTEKQVLEELEKEYRTALKDINQKILMYQSLPETQSRIYHRQYQETLKKQVEAALEKLHSDEYTTINEYLHDAYTDGFVGTMYDLHGQGVPVIAPIDQNAVIKAILTDTKLKHELYDSLAMDINTLKKNISSEISRGIASGMLYDDIARNIKDKTKTSIGRAKTIVRTEGHRIQQASADDARMAAKSKGANVVKQWDATMDGKTRPLHRQLDGQIREVEDPFEIGTKKAMYPGDFGLAEEDCNCRCVALTRSRSALDAAELKILRERAVRHSLYMDDPKKYRGEKLPQLKNYEEFKKSYIKAAEEEKQNQKPIEEIKNAIDFEYGNYTSEDYNKWLDDYEKLNKNIKLSDKELEVIENYTEGSFISMNGVSRGDIEALRKKGFTDADIKKAQESADILEGALHKFKLDTNIVTHRFERDVSWLTGTDNSVDALEKMIGQQYTAKGFTSSGMNANRFRFTGGKADAVHFEIVTPKDTDGAFLYISKKGENEFLYNRNTRFVVLDGGERTVMESKLNFKTMKKEKVEVKERFLKVQVVTDADAMIDKATSVVKLEKPKALSNVAKKPKKEAKLEAKNTVDTFKFSPAASIEDAEKAISEFYNEKQFGNLGVSYKGLSLEVANEVNRALIPLYRTFDVDKMGGIVAPAGNTMLGKQISGAFAGYSPIRKGFVLNRKHLKDMKTATKAFAKENETLKHLLEHPEQYDFSKITKSAVELINRSKISGRTSVPRTVGQALQHEFGHAIERRVFESDLWPEAKKNMNTFADRISGYAGTNESEYVAESFVSYLIGEGKTDPVLVQIFEGLRRK